MSRQSLPSRPRILGSQACKYVGKTVTVIGEVTNITPHAKTLTLRSPDDESFIVLLPKTNTTLIEPNLLTEVSGKLVSQGQIESSSIKQFSQKDTSTFNRSLFVEAAQIMDAYRSHYDV